MKPLLPLLLLIPLFGIGQDESDSLHDRRFYDSLGRHWMIEYTYLPKQDASGTQFHHNNSGFHDHFPSHITIIEYSGRSRQKVVWEGAGIYSEQPCASDNGALWVRRYLQTLNKK